MNRWISLLISSFVGTWAQYFYIQIIPLKFWIIIGIIFISCSCSAMIMWMLCYNKKEASKDESEN